MVSETASWNPALLPDALDSLPFMVSYADRDLRYRYCNKVHERWFSLRCDAINGRRIEEILGRQAFCQVRPHLESALEGRDVEDQSWVFFPDGVNRFVLSRYIPDRGPQGGVSGVFILVSDMTRERIGEAPSEAGEPSRAVADAAPIMLWMTDTEGACTYVNQHWLDFTGRTLGQTLGSGWADDLHPEDRPKVRAAGMGAIASRKAFQIDYRIRQADGAYRWVQANGAPRTGSGGRFLGLIGSATDITERHAAEAAMQRRLSQLSAVSWVSGVAAGASTPQDVMEAALRGLTMALGSDRCAILLPDDDGVMRFKASIGLSDRYRKAIEEGWPFSRQAVPQEILMVEDVASGVPFKVSREATLEEGVRSLAVVPMILRERLIGHLAVFFDSPRRLERDERDTAETIGRHVLWAVDRHRAEQQMLSLNQTLERRVSDRTAEAEARTVQLRALALDLSQTEERERRSLATALHDHLQQLLVAAQLKLSGLQGKRPLDRVKINELDSILQESIQASRQITLDLSPPILFDGGLVPALEWLTRHLQEKYGLRAEIRTQTRVEETAEAVRSFLFRAVRELLINVVKHAKTDQAEVVVADGGERRIRIDVVDRGRGFEASRAEAWPAAGGFGLLSVRERAEGLGGTMTVQSSPGDGTRVSLLVPTGGPAAAQSEEPPASAPPPRHAADRPSGGRGRCLRVLIADDHKIVREGLAALLEGDRDIEAVAQASDGEEALRLVRTLHPDVVVMDVSMPGMNGVEATRRIMSEAPGIRIIALSMYESDDMAKAMLQAGAGAYLTKDRAAQALLDAIRMPRVPASPREG
ncbi:MAG TPA: response regulator [Candidatus Polarisedimenticolia bacterium]|nr:response regulator [Candidatus Polarisedimenticolia bacterium]